jgi:hypothetical protein
MSSVRRAALVDSMKWFLSFLLALMLMAAMPCVQMRPDSQLHRLRFEPGGKTGQSRLAGTDATGLVHIGQILPGL